MGSPLLSHINYRKGEGLKNSMCLSPLVKNSKDSPSSVKHHDGSIKNSPCRRDPTTRRNPKGQKTMIHLAPDSHFQFSQLSNDNPGSDKNIPYTVNVKAQGQSLFTKKLEDAGILKSLEGQLEDADIPQFTNALKKKVEIGQQAKDIGTCVKIMRQFIETELPGLSKERKKFYKLKLTEDLRNVNMHSEKEITMDGSNISPGKIHRRDGKSMRIIPAGRGMSHKLVLQKKSKNFLPFTPLELKTFQYNNSPRCGSGELAKRSAFFADFDISKIRSGAPSMSNGQEGSKRYGRGSTNMGGSGWMNRMMVQSVPIGKSSPKMMKKPERRAHDKRTTHQIKPTERSLSITKSEAPKRKAGNLLDLQSMKKAKRGSG